VKKLAPLFVANSQTSVQILFKELRPALAEFPFLARCYSGSQRLSLPVFVRLREDQARVVKALNEGVTLLVMGLGFMLAGVGSIAPWIIPPLLGSKWLPALIVYPFISADNLTGGVSNLHASILYLLRKPWRVAVCRISLSHNTLRPFRRRGLVLGAPSRLGRFRMGRIGGCPELRTAPDLGVCLGR
jgi:hypothetical protein